MIQVFVEDLEPSNRVLVIPCKNNFGSLLNVDLNEIIEVVIGIDNEGLGVVSPQIRINIGSQNIPNGVRGCVHLSFLDVGTL
jgi:hypothetical protein